MITFKSKQPIPPHTPFFLGPEGAFTVGGDQPRGSVYLCSSTRNLPADTTLYLEWGEGACITDKKPDHLLEMVVTREMLADDSLWDFDSLHEVSRRMGREYAKRVLNAGLGIT